jgi:uncharacterized protein (TIGR02300 family)
MIKPTWGLKRLCQGCGAHFYDLKRHPAICPKCDTVFDVENLYRAKRGRNVDTKEDSAEVVKLFKDDLDLDLEDKEEDDSDTLLEDTSDLEEDEDLPEVLDHEHEEDDE